jgi:hypothetical protein
VNRLHGIQEATDSRFPFAECDTLQHDFPHEAVEAHLMLHEYRVSGMMLDLQRWESRARHARILVVDRVRGRPEAAIFARCGFDTPRAPGRTKSMESRQSAFRA